MAALTTTVPYLRTSPVRVPRRDMTLGRLDSLALTVQIVDRDSPDGVPLALAGDPGDPVLEMIVWPDIYYRSWWDYGAPFPWYGGPRSVLWAGAAVPSSVPGAFVLTLPSATMGQWPRRCRYALQLDWADGTGTSLLIEGALNVLRAAVIP